MMGPHLWIRDDRQVLVLWILFGLILLVGGVLGQFAPPGGWIPLEFPAWTSASPGNAPDQWSAAQRETALFGLGLDFLFLALYPLFLFLLCARAASKWHLPPALRRLSGWCAAVVLLAAPLDALENAGLHRLITGNDSPMLQAFITAVAAPKWFVSLATAVVGMVCLAVHLWRRRLSRARG